MLMSRCKNFIIANSTYSWWAAWLSESKNKIILCPDPVRFDIENYWSQSDLIPRNWIKI